MEKQYSTHLITFQKTRNNISLLLFLTLKYWNNSFKNMTITVSTAEQQKS